MPRPYNLGTVPMEQCCGTVPVEQPSGTVPMEHRPSPPPWQPWAKILFFALVVRPLVLFVIGFNIRHRERLPKTGPLLLVANHNSHLDTLVLMSLLPLRRLPEVRPVAAADYFLKGPLMAWFATHLIGIVPIARRPPDAPPPEPADAEADVLAGCAAALAQGCIVILYPEGTRGEPEAMQDFKSGVARLAERCKAPVQPVFLHGLGKALPKGSLLPVPFFCDVVVGTPIAWQGNRLQMMQSLKASMAILAAEVRLPAWE
jgi:1-acyl-sn-glycerol-3-phosphate acyltransferase